MRSGEAHPCCPRVCQSIPKSVGHGAFIPQPLSYLAPPDAPPPALRDRHPLSETPTPVSSPLGSPVLSKRHSFTTRRATLCQPSRVVLQVRGKSAPNGGRSRPHASSTATMALYFQHSSSPSCTPAWRCWSSRSTNTPSVVSIDCF